MFQSLPLAANAALFVLAAAGVWITGTRLTGLADEIAERFSLARSLVGLLFLALATSLPEVVTTLTAAVDSQTLLLVNNLLGGIALQTAVLAVADFWARGALTSYPRKPVHALEAVMLISLLGILQAAIVLDEPVEILGIGLGTIALGLAYGLCIYMLRQQDGIDHWVPVDLPDEVPESRESVVLGRLQHLSTDRVLVETGLACLAILLLGVALVGLSEAIADQSGLGSSLIGVTFLAGATSLPELSTTIAAVRMGAYTLAISNIFGSNLIMIVLLLPADAIVRSRPLLSDVGQTGQLAIATGIIVTGIYVIGLIIRRKPKIGGIGLDSALVLAVYAASLVIFFFLK